MTDHHPRTATYIEDGFTLIELLVAMIVLGMLAGIVVFGLGNYRTMATVQACRTDVTTVAKAVEAYGARTGSYAGVSVDQLQVLGYLETVPPYVVTIDTASGAVSSPTCP
jgi:prepilin-type N-terminal cleavage/methylation domain-containing protein